MPIKSFAEAEFKLSEIARAVDDISAFLQMADKTISAVNMLKGEAKSLPVASEDRNGNVPESWTDRVIKLFRQTQGTMTVQEVIKQYEHLGWPRPETPRALFKGIYGAMFYLKTRKGILVKEGDAYRLNE